MTARYMLSVHSVEGDTREPPTAEEMQHNWQQLRIVEAEMQSTGAWVFSARLHDASTATVVRVANGERVRIDADGEFVETVLGAPKRDVQAAEKQAGPGMAPADSGPTRSRMPSKRQMEPPPAATVCTASIGAFRREPAITVSPARSKRPA